MHRPLRLPDIDRVDDELTVLPCFSCKKDGETKEDIVRGIVAKDYASGSPTAAELGISSPTSSNEAFRSFLVFVFCD